MKSLQTDHKWLSKKFREDRYDAMLHPDDYSAEEKAYLEVTEEHRDWAPEFLDVETDPMDTEGTPKTVNLRKERVLIGGGAKND